MKLEKKFGIVLLLDVIFIFIFFFLLVLYLLAYNWSGSVFLNLPLSKIQITEISQIPQLQQGVIEAGKLTSQFVYRAVLSILVLFIVFVLSISLFKGINWSIVMKKKFNFKFFKKFLFLNFLWFGIWLFIFFMMLLVSKIGVSQLLFLMQMVLIFYFTPILYANFDVKKKIPFMIKETFSKGIIKSSSILVIFLKVWGTLFIFFTASVIAAIASKSFAAFCFVVLFLFWHAKTKYYLFDKLSKIK